MGSWLVNLLKNLAKIIVPCGTGAILGGIAEQATRNADKITKIAAGAATLVLDGMISKAACDYFDDAIDDLDSQITKRLPEGESANAD